MGFRRSTAAKGGGRSHYRSSQYEAKMAVYERRYHNRPPSDFTREELEKKQRMRDWLTAQSDLPRKHRMMNGAIPKDAPEVMRRRFRQPE